MQTFELRQKARKLWNTPYNQRAWVRAVLQLGDHWLLKTPIQVSQNAG